MLIELHLLQNFAPSCLNRDDTNSPKDCEFGGVRRARISSQCIKRAIRTYFKDLLLLLPENLAKRTVLLVDLIKEGLTQAGKDPAMARQMAEAVAKGWSLGLKKEKTEHLLFLGTQEVASLIRSCEAHWDTLSQMDFSQPEEGAEAEGGQSRKDRKKAGKAAMPVEFNKTVEEVLDGGKAVDIALFGRMLANLPKKNIDAACQVAHAISTNKISMEFDYYTAVDDLQPPDKTGAEYLGTAQFNSACFYRYANIHFGQLTQNLGNDVVLARKSVEAFLRAAVAAIPTGKQNSMAAHNPPSLVFAVVRDQGLWSLANAFVNPLRPDGKKGLVEKSITALEEYWTRLAAAYGEAGIQAKPVLVVDGELGKLKESQVPSLEALIQTVMAALPGDQP
ncbi:MAG: type I-E CRISPR-associated protein Cas7/Cse4/CasC [Deltaproteobacteria bacterium]|nr:type I-E CRISPR-associated protein Cas7/Cse4/CasC [Deltaproteobacteria bacterium]